jgi:DNA-binding transcriptional LysR family regulator
MLDVRRLRILREFAARGTISAAAEALAYTPSAVSQQLAQLERETGVALFQRAGRRLHLTDAGRTLVAHADAVLDRLERAEAELAGHAGALRGTVRVAAFQLGVLNLVLPALTILAEQHPELRVELVEAPAEASLPLVAGGRLDLAIAEEYEHAPRPRQPQLERIYLEPDDMVLALPRDCPAAASGAPVPLAAMRDAAWATADEGTAYADMVARLCRSVGGFEPDVRHRTNDFRILMEVAAQGHAVAMVPALGKPELDERVAVRRLAEGAFPRSVFLAIRAADRLRPSTVALIAALTSIAD